MLEMMRTSLKCRVKTLARRALPSRFLRHEDGSTAVEFGLILLPFIALTFAIMETALVFFADQTLETAVADSARLIMTGPAQTGNFQAADFKNAVCSRIYGLFNCSTGIYINVQTYTSFGAITYTPPIDTHGNL